MESTILSVVQKMYAPSLVGRFFSLFLPRDPLAKYGKMVVKYTRLLDIPWDYERIYNDHNAWIKSLVPEERLLVFNCKEDWEPLCRFLGKKVPERQFPRGNDQRAYLENVRLLEEQMGKKALGNMAITLGGFVGMVLAGTFTWTRLF